MAVLTDFIERTARQGWKWGERDCLLWLGLWSLEAVGVDGGAEWRGRYSTRLGCLRTLNRSGGVLACVERGATVAGMVRTDEPKAGAVGIIKVQGRKGLEEAGAIFNGKRWCALTPWGVLSVRTDPVAAWNLP